MNRRQKMKRLKKELVRAKGDNRIMRDIIKDSPRMAELYYLYNRPVNVTTPEREKGEWIRHKSKLANVEDSRECSICHVWLNWDMPRNSFCPNCGADMRGKANESV